MAESAAVKIPLDKWGESPVYFYPDQGICLWPLGFESICNHERVDLHLIPYDSPCYPYNLHLGPGTPFGGGKLSCDPKVPTH